MYPIEKGVPVVAKRAPRRGPRSKYPLAVMRAGDSFFVPAAKTAAPRTARALSVAVSQYKKKAGGTVQFTLRTVANGVRVWRIK